MKRAQSPRTALGLLAIVALLVSACGQAASSTSTSSSTSGTAAASGTATTSSAGQPVHLTMFVFAAPGHMDVPEGVAKAYMQAHPNIKIDFVESSNATEFPKQLAAYKTDPNHPLVDIGYYNASTVAQGQINNMWMPLDASKIPNLSNIDQKFRQPNDVGIEFAYGPYGLLYNNKLVKTPPDTYADLWSNPAFKGKVVLWDEQLYPVMLAAKFNGGSGTDIAPGFQMWSQHASQISTFANSNQQLENALVSGQATLAVFDLQQAHIWAQQGAPIGTAIPKEGAIAWPLYIEVTKGETPAQMAVIYDFLNQLISTQTLTDYSKATFYVPTDSNLPLPANVAALYSPDQLKNSFNLDWLAMAQNQTTWQQEFDTQIKAKVGQ